MPYGVPFQVPDRRHGAASGLCALWVAFLNVFEDGSSERGMMAYGGPGNRFQFASVVQRHGLEFSTDQLDVDYEASPDGYLAPSTSTSATARSGSSAPRQRPPRLRRHGPGSRL